MIQGKDELRKAYQDDRVAQDYVANRFMSPLGAILHARQTSVVRNVIRRQGISRAAEIAPGPARLTVDIVPFLETVTLMDASLQMLQEARRSLLTRKLEGKARYVQADAFALPIEGSFDLVYSFRLIRHFDIQDRRKLYREIGKILNPGGWFIFDAVNRLVSQALRHGAAPGEYEHHDALLTSSELKHELELAGFQVSALIGVQYRYSWLRKCQIYIAPRSQRLARWAMEGFNRLGGEPLEWVVVCRRV
jgi:SAM-dependent methyltransferase